MSSIKKSVSIEGSKARAPRHSVKSFRNMDQKNQLAIKRLIQASTECEEGIKNKILSFRDFQFT